ncbi:MAG: Fic family protein [Bacteroidota bacterium]|nr:Fic family protein [Bacteroidota bacterium]
MKDLLEHIESLKRLLNELEPLSHENQQRLDKKFRLEWNYNSNHIEGNTLTYGETELLLIFGDTKGQHEIREFDEMRGHDIALKLIQDLANDTERGLTETFIRQINATILKEPFYKEAKTPDGQSTRKLIKIGQYKSLPNHVQLVTGEMFYYASPEETSAKMFDLMNWYNEESLNKNLHPVEVAAELHYRFVCIHPFDDGNGRIARLLMNYHLLKNGMPAVIIKSTDKKKYLFALHEADIGNIESFKNYIAEQLVWSYEISIKAAKGESIDESGDWEKKVQILTKKTLNKTSINNIKNIETSKEIIDKSFTPLVQGINKKLIPLFDLYADQSFYLALNGKGTKASNFFQDFLSINQFVKEDLYDLFFSHSLNTFLKNGINAFNSNYNIVFKFSESIYAISYKNTWTPDIQKNYGDFLTTQEIENIETYIGEDIYNQIENNLKNS